MEYITVGKIVTTFGIKGELKVNPLTDKLERFDIPGPYYIGRDRLEVEIEKYRVQKNQIVIKFKDFDNINEVLDFVNTDILVSKDDRVQLDQDDYYIDELVGLDVYYNSAHIGKLKDVIHTPANDIYIISGKDGSYAVPAVKEFILGVKLEEKAMDVKLLEGMEYEV